jgi:hypothetical protein
MDNIIDTYTISTLPARFKYVTLLIYDFAVAVLTSSKGDLIIRKLICDSSNKLISGNSGGK